MKQGGNWRQKVKYTSKALTKPGNLSGKKFHKNVRNLKSSKTEDYWDLLKITNKSETVCKIAIKTFRDHFAKLSQSPIEYAERQYSESFDPRNISHAINEDLNKLFTLDEIKLQIKNLEQKSKWYRWYYKWIS